MNDAPTHPTTTAPARPEQASAPRSDAPLPRQVEDPSTLSPADARSLTSVFLDRLAELEEGTAEYQYVRNTLIEMNQSLVRFATRRFLHRGAEEMDDLFQAGVVGLIKAVDRFDLTREVEFTTFALPYIRGEIKRHLRDTTWAVHVPRRLQELRVELAKAKDHLENVLGAEPTSADLARRMGVSQAEVTEAMAASNGYATASLDATAAEGEGSAGDDRRHSYADVLGIPDPALELFEDFHCLAPLLRGLSPHERRILRLRFGEEWTQRQIGEALGCSQMHVSRQLTAIYAKLRPGLLPDQR